MRRRLLLVSAMALGCVSQPPAPVPSSDVLLVIGDSIAEGRCARLNTGPPGALAFRQDGRWRPLSDPSDSETTRGSFWPLVARELAAHGHRVVFVTAATGSTALLTDWQPGQPAFERMRRQVQAAHLTRVRAALAHLGANDAVGSKTPTVDEIVRGIDHLSDALWRDYRAPLILAGLGDVQTGHPPDRDRAIRVVRAAIALSYSGPHVSPGPDLSDLTPDDGVHYTTDVSTRTIAARWTAAIERAVYQPAP